VLFDILQGFKLNNQLVNWHNINNTPHIGTFLYSADALHEVLGPRHVHVVFLKHSLVEKLHVSRLKRTIAELRRYCTK